jgi:hypothetical protein
LRFGTQLLNLSRRRLKRTPQPANSSIGGRKNAAANVKNSISKVKTPTFSSNVIATMASEKT